MTLQTAPVDRALGSVKRMCSSGHLVVFDDDSNVQNKMTGEESGNYIMNLWVMPSEGQGLYEATLAIKSDERVRPTDDSSGTSKGVAGESAGP